MYLQDLQNIDDIKLTQAQYITLMVAAGRMNVYMAGKQPWGELQELGLVTKKHELTQKGKLFVGKLIENAEKRRKNRKSARPTKSSKTGSR